MSLAIAQRTSLLIDTFCDYGGSLIEKPLSIVVIVAMTTFNTLLGGPVLGVMSFVSTLIGHASANFSIKYDIKWLQMMKNEDALAYIFHVVNVVFFVVLPVGTWFSAPVAMIFCGRDLHHYNLKDL